ncbi:MAG: ABC transporter permease [Bacteroidetes bacterium]|nr:MAG: ABC transporter permease [Bacteroidota bacterium]
MQEKHTDKHEHWTEVISARSSWFDLRLDELWRYRDLVMLFVWRDFVAQYKQTILGPIWHIIQPLLTTLTFLVVFTNIAQIPTDSQPPLLFYMAGVTIWGYFSKCITSTSTTFITNAAIFGKVYFPRLTVPVSTVLSGLIAFAIQLGVFLLFYLYYYFFTESNLQPNLWLLALPLFLALMGILGLGVGIIISALTTKYRDLSLLVTFGVQLLMYATPVIYPLSAIKSEKWRFILELNPTTPLIEGFRYAFFGTGSFTVYQLGYCTVITLVLFLIGLGMFHKVEKSFMDTV